MMIITPYYFDFYYLYSMLLSIIRRKCTAKKRNENTPVHLDEIGSNSAATTASKARTTNQVYQNVEMDTTTKTDNLVYQNVAVVCKRKGKYFILPT